MNWKIIFSNYIFFLLKSANKLFIPINLFGVTDDLNLLVLSMKKRQRLSKKIKNEDKISQ